MNNSQALLDNTKSLLKDLVAFNSVSSQSNLDIIHYIQEYLEGFNITSSIIHNSDKTKGNLFATINGGNDLKHIPGIILSGHSDVVPVNADEWHHPPFTLTEQQGKLYGRGSVDMKGFIACVLAQVPLLQSSHLKIPIHLCFSYDEEVGCLGVPSLIDYIKTNVETKPALAIIGEPTSMRIIKSQKGRVSYKCKIKGQAGHTSMAPLFNNSIELAAQIISKIAEIAKKNRISGPFDDGFSITHNTLTTTLISGGNAINVIPEYCEFCFEIRYIPTENINNLLEQIKKEAEIIAKASCPENAPAPQITWERQSYNPGLIDKTETLAEFAEIQQLLVDQGEKVSFGTEAPFFQNDGEIISIICGPGDIAQAHQPNEYIEVSELQMCLDFLQALHANYLSK